MPTAAEASLRQAMPPQAVQDFLAGLAEPLTTAGSYLGDVMRTGGQSFDPATAVQAVAPLAMALMPGRGPMRAYHGSPHTFERFDITKLGSGEGNQTYGHGLYFAQEPKIASYYRKQLAGKEAPSMFDEAYNNAWKAIDRSGFKMAGNVLADIRANPFDWEQRFGIDPIKNAKVYNAVEDYLRSRPGRMYEVNIDQPETFLNREIPISEQTPEVQAAVKRLGFDYPHLYSGEDIYGITHGKRILENQADIANRPLSAELVSPAAQAAQDLRDAGIQGVTYYDQFSRNRFQTPGEPPPTSNIVVFNDKLIDILRKYGIPGVLGSGAALDQLQSGNYGTR